MGNYLMSTFKCYFNFIPNVGEITILDKLHSMPTSDKITHGTRTEPTGMKLILFLFVLQHYVNQKTTWILGLKYRSGVGVRY
jgi:hypothetical protein